MFTDNDVLFYISYTIHIIRVVPYRDIVNYVFILLKNSYQLRTICNTVYPHIMEVTPSQFTLFDQH